MKVQVLPLAMFEVCYVAHMIAHRSTVAMPKQVGKSSFMSKYGQRIAKTHDKIKDNPVDLGMMNLPAGIEGGIAQLCDCRFMQIKEGKEKAGEWMFYAAGVVILPKAFAGIPVEGLQTKIMEPMYDTPLRTRKTFEDHLEHVYLELGRLGVDMSEVDPSDLEEVMQDLLDQQPYFRFRTWKGQAATTGKYKGREPMVNHQWGGVCDYSPDETSDDEDTDDQSTVDVDDDDDDDDTNGDDEQPVPVKGKGKKGSSTTAKSRVNGKVEKAAPPATKKKTATAATKTTTAVKNDKTTKQNAPSTKKGKGKAKKEESPPPADDFDEFGDLDSLAAAADDGDEDAMEKLTGFATAAGLTDNDIDEAENWHEVVKLIMENSDTPADKDSDTAVDDDDADDEDEDKDDSDEDDDDDDNDVAIVPEKKEVYNYYPIDPKTKKPAKKPVEVKITAVDKTKKTVGFTSLDDTSKKWKDVSWSDLEPTT